VRYQATGARRERRQAILAVAEAAKEHAEKFAVTLVSENPRAALSMVFHQSIVDSMVGALSTVPAHELNTRDGVIAFLTIRDQFIFLGQTIQTLLDGVWEHQGLRPALEEGRRHSNPEVLREIVSSSEKMLVNNVEGHIRQIRASYEKLASTIGSDV
jgi:hypothetical protein